jgi:hypothetical protein
MVDFKVVDRRRVTASGARPTPPQPGDLPSVSHKTIDVPLRKASRHFKEHLRRNQAALEPELFWVAVRGLLISGEQTYAGACALVADRRPKTLPLQASILVRSLLEALGNLLALSEDPTKRSFLFGCDGYRSAFEEYQRLKAGFGDVPKWKDWLGQSQQLLSFGARLLGLTAQQANDPSSTYPGGGRHRGECWTERGPC